MNNLIDFSFNNFINTFFFIDNLLIIISITPLLGALLVLCFRGSYVTKNISLFFSILTFFLTVLLWSLFDESVSHFQFLVNYKLIPSVNVDFILGIDGLSLFFIVLTALIVPLCILSSWNSIKYRIEDFFIAFLIMESLLMIVFSSLDLILFYVFFESVLIPMFIIVGIWGSRERKIRAGYMLFLYTLLGSVLMLLSIIFIHYQVGTTNYHSLLGTIFNESHQKVMWLAFFISFAVKIPIVPVHVWLPEAHVEAPTAGSVILAGILLKLGSYGVLRFLMPLFPYGMFYYLPLVYTLGIISIIYTSLIAIRQTDIKRVIAYASVAHMNLIVLGLFCINTQGIEGSIYQMLSHGVVSSALFLCVGVLYDRYHTRLIRYYNGCVYLMPLFSLFFLIFTMANIALPGTSSFVGEALIFIGLFKVNIFVTFFSATGMILGGAYSLWLYNRVIFGNIKKIVMVSRTDLNTIEFWMFIPLIILTIIMGVYPAIFLDVLHTSVGNLIYHMKLII